MGAQSPFAFQGLWTYVAFVGLGNPCFCCGELRNLCTRDRGSNPISLSRVMKYFCELGVQTPFLCLGPWNLVSMLGVQNPFLYLRPWNLCFRVRCSNPISLSAAMTSVSVLVVRYHVSLLGFWNLLASRVSKPFSCSGAEIFAIYCTRKSVAELRYYLRSQKDTHWFTRYLCCEI